MDNKNELPPVTQEEREQVSKYLGMPLEDVTDGIVRFLDATGL